MERYAILLACSSIIFCSISADLSDIKIYNSTKTWISAEDFKIIIEESLYDATCSNIFISGDSEGTIQLFKEFVKNYQYTYTVNKKTYGCTGYFVISASATKLVEVMPKIPTTIATTEILIVVDDHVEESTILLQVAKYGYADVNIAAHNGLWTLSESYVRPRHFKKVSRPHDMKHKHGIVNLQGQKLQIAAYFYPPFSYLDSSVNRTIAGIEAEIFTLEDESEIDGVEVKLFLMLAEVLNFTYTIRKPNNGYEYGVRNGSNWLGGMIGQIFHKEVDMAFSSIWLSFENYGFANLTNSWIMLQPAFLVPRPKPYASFWALAKPFSPEVWSALLAVLIVQSVCVWTSARINTRIPKRFRCFTITLTEMMGRLLGTYAPKKMHGVKVLLQLWHFIGILMVTAYSSSLAAKLANRTYDKRIDTVRQFIDANLTWGCQCTDPDFSLYFDQTDYYGSQLPNHFEHENSEADRHRKFLKGNYAQLGAIIGSAFFPEEYVRLEDLKGYRAMKLRVASIYAAFAVQPWLLRSVNRVLLWLHESGLVQYHLSDVLHRRTPPEFREVLIEYDVIKENTRVLELIPLGVGFSLLLVGFFVSTTVFYFELRSVRGSKSIREVLLDIRSKREIRRCKELRVKRKLFGLKKIQPEIH